MYAPLIRHKFITGELDGDGYIQDYDEEQAAKFVFGLIKFMCYGDKS